MMTDKPTSKNSDKPKESSEPENTITKSTQKSAPSSLSNTPNNHVNVNMSNSTDAIKDKALTNKKNETETAKAAEEQSNNKNDAQTTTDKASASSSSSQKIKTTMKSEPKTQAEKKSKISKLAILSLLIALLAVVGVVLLYFWHVQQQTALTVQLQQIQQATIKESELAQQKLLKTLQAQEQNLVMQFENSANNMESQTQENIEKLNQMVEKFSQNQPTDWLVHEAEYLIRVAARTLWLEKDTTAAIGLLQDADARIAELNDPEILPIRQLIYQDIEALQLIPKLETEKTILSLMALNEQIQSLPLMTLSVPQEAIDKERFTLSENISDWRENIAKTWHKFLETFVVVHSRVGELEPILPVDQRHNLKENLSLKLQIAQWAASKGNQDLFIQSLNDAQAWLMQYFDVNNSKNTAFIDSIERIKNNVIVVEDELKLVSLKALRQVLSQKKSITPANSILSPAALEESINETSEANTEAASEAESPLKPAPSTELESNAEELPAIAPETIEEQPADVKEAEIEKLVEEVTDMSEA